MQRHTHIIILTALVFLLSAASAFVLMEEGYISYLGWEGEDGLGVCKIDDNGDLFLYGHTNISGLPVTIDAYQKDFSGKRDSYIVRLNKRNEIEYLSYFGGSGYDGFKMLYVDSLVYIFGSTDSRDLPLSDDCYQSVYGGGQRDCYIAKLNMNTNELLFGTYIGGSGDDYVWPRLVVDDSGDIYCAGYTTSSSFPRTSSAAQRLYGGGADDAFIAKLSSDGERLIYSTLLGGNGNDEALGLAVDSLGQAYVCGVTGSTNFPTSSSAFQDSINTLYGDCFVTKLSSDGKQFLGSTYLGGQYQSRADGILLDGTRGVYITGRAGQGFPTTTGAFRQTTLNPLWDGFVAKMSPDLSTLIYSTYAGGTYRTQLVGVIRDEDGNIYVCGETSDPKYPVPSYSRYQPSENHKLDLLFVVFDSTLTVMLFGGIIGGSGTEFSTGLTRDIAGHLYLSGITESMDFPATPGAFQESYGGGDQDGVLVKIPKEEIVLSAGQAPAIPSTLSLSQSYPNPVVGSGMVTIPYTVTSRGAGSITVYNSAGREVYAYRVHHETAGKYNAHIQLPGLPHGMYFYTLLYNNTQITRKMVVE